MSSGMDDQEIKNKIIEKLLRGRFISGKNVTIDQFVSNQAGLPTHEHGRARQLLEDEMIPQGEGSIAKYGGQRNAIHLTDVDEAVQYLKDNGGNVPFGF
jgi:hypothetical protein